MNERAIFMEALDRETLAERAAYLDEACGGDTALRQRVEALLTSHEQAGSFLGKPVPERLAEGLAAPEASAETQGEPPAADGGERLDFLTPSDKPGSLGRLGHYEIQEAIGRGGMGVVLRAFDDKLHRVVAIKVMASSLPANGAARKRFVREARAAAAVRDEHVVGVYAVEDAAEAPYLVMEYIAGVSLQERLDRGGPLEVKEILRIGLQAASGLAAAHAQGLIHRDVKPANILLENHVERVKITDFGLARAVDDASLTQSGVIAGTPHYMAPEQARGEAVDHRADLFSLGGVLYALCTGRPPFRAENTLAVLKRVCEDTPRPIRETNPDVPVQLVEIIARLQAKDPAERFQTAWEVVEVLGRELAAMQRGDTERPLPPRPPPARRSRRVVVAAAVLLLFGAGFMLTESVGMTHVTATVLGWFAPSHPTVAKGDDGRNDVQPAEPPVPAASGPVQPFVILANAGRGEKSYETLAEAVAQAWNGDVIEIRGDGPFDTPRIDLEEKALVIRAGAGFRPVIEMRSDGNASEAGALRTSGWLVLEGLEFHRRSPPRDLKKVSGPVVASVSSSRLWMANCRVVGFQETSCNACAAIHAYGMQCEVRNSHFVIQEYARFMEVNLPNEGRVIAEGNVIVAREGGFRIRCDSGVGDRALRVDHNTMLIDDQAFYLALWVRDPGDGSPPYCITSSENVVHTRYGTAWLLPLFDVNGKPAVEGKELDALARRLIDWRESHNAYVTGELGLYPMHVPPRVRSLRHMSVTDWEQFWGLKDTGSLQGSIRTERGPLPGPLGAPLPWLCDATNFRLAKDSTGKGVGKGGRDLGADVDLVGPGPAYERWKKTPAYQEWLKESGQKR